MVDNPGDFNNQVGWDLYVNPWWALRKVISNEASVFAECMTRTLGEPDLWFNGLFHELLWGPRHIHRGWRPGFNANLSGGNGKLWNHFWLPWRAGHVGPGETVRGARQSAQSLRSADLSAMLEKGVINGIPFACNTLDTDISVLWDVPRMEGYARIADTIPVLAEED